MVWRTLGDELPEGEGVTGEGLWDGAAAGEMRESKPLEATEELCRLQ